MVCGGMSTYRVQVRPGFDLDATAGLAGYLAEPRRHPSLQRAAAGRHPRLGARLRRGRPTRVNPELGGAAAWQRLVRALRAAGLGPGRGHRAQPPRGGRAGRQPGLVGRAAHGAGLARTRPGSTSTGPAAGCCCRCSADEPDALDDLAGRRGRAALPRAPVPDRRGHRRRHRRGGARPAALPAGGLAARRHRAQLPPLLRRLRPGRAAGGGPGGVRRHPRRDPALGRRRAAWTASGSTTRTGCATRPGTCAGCGPRRPAAGCVVEKILEYGEELPPTGRSPAPPATTRCAEVCGAVRRPCRRGDFAAAGRPLHRTVTSWRASGSGRRRPCSPPS